MVEEKSRMVLIKSLLHIFPLILKAYLPRKILNKSDIETFYRRKMIKGFIIANTYIHG